MTAATLALLAATAVATPSPPARAATEAASPAPSTSAPASAASAPAQGVPERWSAVSTTASAITGDVRFSPSQLMFGNGRKLSLAYVRDVSSAVSFAIGDDENARAQLYRVTSGRDLMLQNHNKLCSAVPTYAAVLRTHDAAVGDLIYLTVFSGGAEPRGKGHDHVCAGFTYAPATPTRP